MEQEQFENHIQNKFDNFNPGIDNDALWNNIEQQLPQKRNKRGIIWWFLGLLLLVSCGYFGFNSLYNQNAKDVISSSESLKINEVVDYENYLKAQDDLEDIDIKNKEQKEPLVSDSNGSDEKSNANEISSEEKIEKSNSIQKSQKEDTDILGSELSAIELQNSVSNVIENIESNNFENNIAHSTSDYSANKSLDEGRSQSKSIESEISNINGLDDSQIGQAKKLDKLLDISMNSNLLDYERELSLLDLQPRLLNKKVTKSEPRIDLELSASAYLLQRILSKGESANEDIYDEYQSILEQSETPLEAFQFDGGIRYHVNSKWMIRLGANYWSLQEKSMNRVVGQEEVTVNDVIIETVYLPDTVVYVSGSTQVESSFDRDIKRYNRHRSISGSIDLFYKSYISDKFGLNVGVGYEKSFWVRHDGYMQDLGEMEYDLELDMDTRFKDSSQDFLKMGVELVWTTNEKIQFITGLNSKLHLTSWNEKTVILNKKYNLFGVKIGILYNF